MKKITEKEEKFTISEAKHSIIKEAIYRVFANKDVYFVRERDLRDAFPIFTKDEIGSVVLSLLVDDYLCTPILCDTSKGTCETVLALDYKAVNYKFPSERKFCPRTKRFVGGYMEFHDRRIEALDIGVAEPLGDRELVWR